MEFPTLLYTCVIGFLSFLYGLVKIEWIGHTSFTIICAVVVGILLFIRKKLKQMHIIRPVNRKGPLAGVKILDLSVVIAAPWSTAQLVELGAEVIKIESLKLLDSARGLGTSPAKGMAGCVAFTGRGKQSIILDVKKPEGLALFKKLCAQADIMITNFRPGAVDRMGIDYKTCSAINPELIYVVTAGFGQSGPFSQQRIYDPVIQVVSGYANIQLCSKTGKAKMSNTAWADKMTSMTTTQTMLAALNARKNGAGGQFIDISMLDVALAFNWPDGYRNCIWSDGDKEITFKDKFIDIIPDGAVPNLEDARALKIPRKKARELLKDEKWKKRYMQPNLKAGVFGECIAAKYPVTWDKNSLPIPPPVAMLGEHTVKILRDAGVSSEDAQKLIDTGVCVSTASLLKMKGQGSKARIFSFLDKCQEFSESILAAENKVEKTSTWKEGQGPMAGTKIVECCNLMAGPLGTMLLADQGAEVTKVEVGGKMDPTRKMGENGDKNMGSVFTATNRSKTILSVADKKGLEALLSDADVFVIDADEEERLGINARWAKQLQPEIVYVRINKGGGEYYAQSISGIAGEQTMYDGTTGWLECFMVEKACAYYVAGNITAAVYAGQGEILTVDMEQAAVHWAMPDIFWSDAWLNPKAMKDFPSCDVLFRLFHLKDGVAAFTGALTDAEWKGLSTVFKKHVDGSEIEERVTSGKWNTLPGRLSEVGFLWDWWEKVVIQYTEAEFMEKVKESGIFFGRVNSRKDVLAHEQVKHSETLKVLEHPEFGKCRLARSAPLFSKTPCKLSLAKCESKVIG